MKRKKLWQSGLLLAAGVLGLSSLNVPNVLAANKSVLNWSELSELQTLDTAASLDTTSSEALRNSYEGLYRLGNNGSVHKGLVKTAKLSKDGLTYTFTLQKNAHWSNGDKVTAKDFVYGWRRAVNPATKAANSQLYDGIKNASEIVKGQKDPKQLEIKTVGNYTLKVTLDRKIPYFKSLVAAPVFYPLDQKAVVKYGKEYGTAANKAVYNGPYTVSGWTGSNQKWTLAKNKHYWDKQHVKLAKVNFQVAKSTSTSYNMFQANQLDETNLSTEQARQMKTTKEFVARKQARLNYLQFNLKNKELANANIRKAISYAIDRKQLVKRVLGDGTVAAHSFVPKELMVTNGKDFADYAAGKVGTSYNKKQAQAYLKKGLQELGLKQLSLDLLGDDDDTSKKINEFIQSQLEDNLGSKKVTVNVTNINKKSRIARMQSGDFGIVQTGWGADYQDATSFLGLFSADSVYNFGKWNNPTYDKLLAQAKTQSGTKRLATLKQANDTLLADQAVVPLCQPALATLLKDKVTGVAYNTIGQYNFKEAQVK